MLAGAAFEPFAPGEIADSRDRSLANRLVTTALRRHGHIDRIIGELLTKGLPRKAGGFEAILRLALAQLVYMPELGAHSVVFLAVEALKRDPRGQHQRALLNAVLRRAQANAARYWTLPPELLLPDALRTTWAAAYGEEAVAGIAEALLEGAPLDLTLREADPDLVAALGGEPVVADTVRVARRERSVEDLPGYAEGRWWVQDAAAALPARLLRCESGARVLDLCAAPGGKTAQLCKAGYRVTALDADAGRLERLHQNLARLGYEAELVAGDARTTRPGGPFDAILLDAPCSATGTLRRHPDVLLRHGRTGTADRVRLQRELLSAAAAQLRPGGTLVYSVCSLEPEEGPGHLDWVREAHPELALDPIASSELADFPAALAPDCTLRTWPGLPVPGTASGTLDGFFAVRFRRAAR